MWFLLLPDAYPLPFLVFSLVWSGYQAYVGGVAGGFIADSARAGATASTGARTRTTAYVLPHAALYFVCSAAGFLAWRTIATLTLHVSDWSHVAGGTGAILIALGSVAITGLSGALPRILYLGGRP